MKRPTGISVLFWVYLILGILSLLWGTMVLGVGGLSSLFGSLFSAEGMMAFGGSSALAGYIGIVTAVVEIVVAFGLLGLHKWAWFLAVLGLGLNVVAGVMGMFSGRLYGFICGSLGLIVPVIVLFYLLKSGTRAAFNMG